MNENSAEKKSHLPPLFQEIIVNDAELTLGLKSPNPDLPTLRRLKARKRELIRAAEKYKG